MSYKEFATSEIDILTNEINKKLEYLNGNPEDMDAETIGTEKIYAEKTKTLLDIINTFVRDGLSSEVDRTDGLFIANILKDIFNGMPLSDMNSYEDKPEEWVKWENVVMNSRYSNLIRYRSKFVDENGEEKEKFLYSDYDRFTFYNLIDYKNLVSIGDTGVPAQLMNILNQLFPIEFPYNVKNGRIKVYIELFECKLQDDAEPVKTLALCHYKTKDMNKAQKIFKFFDITGGAMVEIDVKAYVTRRQIFAKSEDSHENDTL